MATSWTEADITALETAIKSGVLRVRFGDREVQYQSISEMLNLLQTMKDTINSSSSTGSTRCTFGKFSKD